MGCGNSNPIIENKEKIVLNIFNDPYNANLIPHNNSKIDSIFIKLNSFLKEVETLRVFYIDSLDAIIMDSLNYFYKNISLSKIFECILIQVSLHLDKELDTNILQLREDVFQLNKNPLKSNDNICNGLLDRFFDYFEIVKTLSVQIDIEKLIKQIRDSQKLYEIEYNSVNKLDKETNSKVFQINSDIIKYGLKLLREIEKFFSAIVDFKVQIKKGIDKVVNFKFINDIYRQIKEENKDSFSNNSDLLKKILWNKINENEKVQCEDYIESYKIANIIREMKQSKKTLIN